MNIYIYIYPSLHRQVMNIYIYTLINLRFSTNLAKHGPQPCFGPSQFQPFPHELLRIPLGLASRHGPARIFDDGSLAINPYRRRPSWVNNSAGNSILINQSDPLRCVYIYIYTGIYTYSFMNQRTFWLDALWCVHPSQKCSPSAAPSGWKVQSQRVYWATPGVGRPISDVPGRLFPWSDSGISMD